MLNAKKYECFGKIGLLEQTENSACSDCDYCGECRKWANFQNKMSININYINSHEISATHEELSRLSRFHNS